MTDVEIIDSRVAVCDIPLPGTFKQFTNSLPTTVALSSAMGTYYLVGLLSTPKTRGNFFLAGLFLLTFLVFQGVLIFVQRACPSNLKSIVGIATAAGIGGAVGLLSYAIASWLFGYEVYPSYERFGNSKLFEVNSGVTFESQGKPGKPGKNRRRRGSDASECSVVDANTYVVDLYKDGKLISQAITDQAGDSE